MSYGQPWRRMTAGPPDGPDSAYPTFSRPASTCFIAAKDVFVPGATGDSFLWDCALAEPIAPRVMVDIENAAVRRNRQRVLMAASGMLFFHGAISSSLIAFSLNVGVSVSQAAQHPGQVLFGVSRLEAALHCGLDPALGLGVAHALDEEIGIATE